MKNTDMRKIRKAMEKAQDARRYEHTLGVAYTATALAMRYGASLKDAEMAGLLHDCAKCLTDEKRLAICEKHNISINEIERRNPFLLHAKVGCRFWKKSYMWQITSNRTESRPPILQKSERWPLLTLIRLW